MDVLQTAFWNYSNSSNIEHILNNFQYVVSSPTPECLGAAQIFPRMIVITRLVSAPSAMLQGLVNDVVNAFLLSPPQTISISPPADTLFKVV